MNSLLDGNPPPPHSKNNRTRNVHIKHVSSAGISYMNVPPEIYTVSAGIQSNEPRSIAGWYVRILHLLMWASYIVNIVSTCLQNTTSAKLNQQHIRQKHKESIGCSYVQQNLLILRVCSIIYALLVMGIHTYSTTDTASKFWRRQQTTTDFNTHPHSLQTPGIYWDFGWSRKGGGNWRDEGGIMRLHKGELWKRRRCVWILSHFPCPAWSARAG